VFAALVGTLALLDAEDRARAAGLVINKLRGDVALLGDGVARLGALTGVPVLGVIPWLRESLVPAEDSLDLDATPVAAAAVVDIAVVRLPRIANFDDFEPLAAEPGVRVRFVRTPGDLGDPDLAILPGTKSTIPDLAWLRARGLAGALVARARAGRPVLGICGGYQMLGESLLDPERVDSTVTAADGLGVLPIETTFVPTKATVRVRARATKAAGLFDAAAGEEWPAYEIHAGRTTSRLAWAERPFVLTSRAGRSIEEPEGMVGAEGAVLGTSLHGLFAASAMRRALLSELARRRGRIPDERWGASPPAAERYARLAEAVSAALDVSALGRLVGLALPRA
jgi:adenosylcobyric acid synthase